MTQMVKTFTDRYPLVGPTFWIISSQYFIVQFIVASSFTPPFSLTHNTISDLGNTACGNYHGIVVCSPEHQLMNVSFIILGVAMILGAVLIYQECKNNIGAFLGFGAMVLAGVGVLFVGLYPENTSSLLHGTGATLVFIFGNVSLIVLSQVLRLPKLLRMYTLLSGVIALTALVFYVSKYYLFFGVGGMERLVAYPQTLWLIVFGIYISGKHLRRN